MSLRKLKPKDSSIVANQIKYNEITTHFTDTNDLNNL